MSDIIEINKFYRLEMASKQVSQETPSQDKPMPSQDVSADSGLVKRVQENADQYYRRYSPASTECETPALEGGSQMTFGQAFELTKGFVIQTRINDSSGPVRL